MQKCINFQLKESFETKLEQPQKTLRVCCPFKFTACGMSSYVLPAVQKYIAGTSQVRVESTPLTNQYRGKRGRLKGQIKMANSFI